VDALASKLKSGRIMPRMAVSTLGKLDEQYAVCLENGMVMHGAALIVAAPARYAERMFYTFVPEISAALLNFYYDTVSRVTLGYQRDDITLPTPPPPDAGFAFEHWTDHDSRVPPGHVLVQAGIRFPLDRATPEAIIAETQKDLGWPTNHVIARVDYWPESHCLHEYLDDHAQIMQTIEAKLPAGVALVGSDYQGSHIENRVEYGRAAARKIVQLLQGH
jgi:protoporphyrinogen oxidase